MSDALTMTSAGDSLSPVQVWLFSLLNKPRARWYDRTFVCSRVPLQEEHYVA